MSLGHWKTEVVNCEAALIDLICFLVYFYCCILTATLVIWSWGFCSFSNIEHLNMFLGFFFSLEVCPLKLWFSKRKLINLKEASFTKSLCNHSNWLLPSGTHGKRGGRDPVLLSGNHHHGKIQLVVHLWQPNRLIDGYFSHSLSGQNAAAFVVCSILLVWVQNIGNSALF